MASSGGICDSIVRLIQGEAGYFLDVKVAGPEGLNSMLWMNKTYAKQPPFSLLASPHLYLSSYCTSDLEDGRRSRKVSASCMISGLGTWRLGGSIEVISRKSKLDVPGAVAHTRDTIRNLDLYTCI